MVEVDPQTVEEIEQAMALPIGHVEDVRQDGTIRVQLSDDGMDLIALGLLAIHDEG